MINIGFPYKKSNYKNLFRVLNDKRKYNIISKNIDDSIIDIYVFDLSDDINKIDKKILKLVENDVFTGFFVLLSDNISKEIINKFSSYRVIKIVEKTGDHRQYLKDVQEILLKYNQRVLLEKSKIAILDDDRLQLNVIQDILKKNGISTVDLYSDFKSFKESMFNYDIYFIDMILPDIYGEEVINRLRREKPKALIIAISSVEKIDTIKSVLYNGADDYLVKPIYRSLFIAKLYSNFRYQLLLIENEIKEKKLKKMAITDGLTGLYNHKYTVDKLKNTLKGLNHEEEFLSIVMIDIDNFKKINDEYGHITGDEILKNISKILKKFTKEDQIVGRYGGEEFLIILPKLSLDEAYKQAESLRIVIEETGYKHIKYTASFGVYEYNGESLESFINKADQLLYKAKDNGKNRVECKF